MTGPLPLPRADSSALCPHARKARASRVALALDRACRGALIVLLCGLLLAGCDTGPEGLQVNLTEVARIYRESVDRRPDRQELERLIAALPAEKLNDLGVLYEREGRLEEAERAYQQAVWRDPRYVRAYVNLGNVARQRGELDQARFRYRQALALDPSSFEAANNFADVCGSEGVYIEEAIGRLEPALGTAEPLRPYGLDTLGWLYHMQGDNRQAAELLGRALEEAEDEGLSATAHEHLAEVLRALGSETEAEKHAREAARIRRALREAAGLSP